MARPHNSAFYYNSPSFANFGPTAAFTLSPTCSDACVMNPGICTRLVNTDVNAPHRLISSADGVNSVNETSSTNHPKRDDLSHRWAASPLASLAKKPSDFRSTTLPFRPPHANPNGNTLRWVLTAAAIALYASRPMSYVRETNHGVVGPRWALVNERQDVVAFLNGVNLSHSVLVAAPA